MRIAALALVAFLSAFAVGRTLAPARCATCMWTAECWSSDVCGSGCVCLKRGMDLTGYCYSTGYAR